MQSQNLVEIFKNWISQASNGFLNNQQLDPAEIEYARKVQDMMSNGCDLKPMYSTVSIPKPNTTGPATVTIQPVI